MQLTLETICSRHRGLPYLALVILCLVLHLPGFFSIPPMDRDESRFVQASRQMLERADYVDIRFQDQPRYRKPVGIYWLQAFSGHLFGSNWENPVWPYRVPSLAGIMIGVLCCFAIGKKLFSAPAAFLGAAFLAVSLVVNLEARTGKTDAVMFATICLAQLALANLYLASKEGTRGHFGWALLMWSALGFGGLIKGPIPLMVSGLTALSLSLWEKRWRWLLDLRPGPGIILMLLLVAPWLIAIHRLSGGDFLVDSLQQDLLGKVASGSESHGAPPGYYLLTFFIFFWPASLLAGLAAPWAWRQRQRPEILFCLAWIIPTWLVFELVVTKLPHYVMPTYPAIALLVAAALHQGIIDQPPPERTGEKSRSDKIKSIGRNLWIGLWLFFTFIMGLLFIVIGPVIEHFMPVYFDEPDNFISSISAITDRLLHPAGVFAGVSVFTIGLIGWTGARQRQLQTIAPRFVLVAALVYIMGFGILMPNLDKFWPSRQLAEELSAIGVTEAAVAGYQEPSVVFLAGTDTFLTGYGDQGARWLADNPMGAVAVEKRQQREFMQTISDLELTVKAHNMVAGFNYSKGQWVELTIFTLE